MDDGITGCDDFLAQFVGCPIDEKPLLVLTGDFEELNETGRSPQPSGMIFLPRNSTF